MTLALNQIADTLEDFIRREIISQQDGRTFHAEDNLLEFQFAVPAADITVENFETVRAIASYLAPKLTEHADER